MRPMHVDIETEAIQNENFRQVIFTGKHFQVVLMSLKPGEEIGNEVHEAVDQFFRIEKGEAIFRFDNKNNYLALAGYAIVVPAGTWHNVINRSDKKELKLYTIYAPPQHPAGTIQKIKPKEKTCQA